MRPPLATTCVLLFICCAPLGCAKTKSSIKDPPPGSAGKATADAPIAVYVTFQPVGCTDSTGSYVEPPRDAFTIVNVHETKSYGVVAKNVVQRSGDGFPAQIETAYADGPTKRWVAWQENGPAIRLGFPIDSTTEHGENVLELFAANTYRVAPSGDHVELAGSPTLRCELVVTWLPSDRYPEFRPPTTAEWQARIADYRASVSTTRTDNVQRSRARQLGYRGVDAFMMGDYRQASVFLELAYDAWKAPTLGLWSARALAKMGQIEAARRRYEETAALSVDSGDPAVQQHAKDEALAELQGLMATSETVQ